MKFARALAVVGLLLLPKTLHASQTSPERQILARESLWLDAVSSHDARTLSSILDDSFVHINYLGHIEGKNTVLARIRSGVPFQERTGGQSVTFEGPVAIVHGLNTIYENGRKVFTLRYTDVYAQRKSTWEAISAQETAVKP